MFCKKCGKQLKDGAQFCIYCGEKVTIPGVSAQPEVKVPEPEVKPVEIPVPEVEEIYDLEPEEEEESSRNLLPFIITGVVAIAAVIAALGYFILKGRSEDSADDTETQVAQEEETEPEESPSNDISEVEDTLEQEPESEETEESTPDEPAEEVNEEGIHTYELIIRDVTWTQAYEDCLSRGGHLVRINSAEEYWAILQQIDSEDKNNIKFWLGGTRGSADSYEYRWAYEDGSYGDEVLNEDDKYASYWLGGEPSYEDEAVGSQEMFMNMFYMRREDRWVWNDVPDDLIAVVNTYAGTVGYICEYED